MLIAITDGHQRDDGTRSKELSKPAKGGRENNNIYRQLVQRIREVSSLSRRHSHATFAPRCAVVGAVLSTNILAGYGWVLSSRGACRVSSSCSDSFKPRIESIQVADRVQDVSWTQEELWINRLSSEPRAITKKTR